MGWRGNPWQHLSPSHWCWKAWRGWSGAVGSHHLCLCISPSNGDTQVEPHGDPTPVWVLGGQLSLANRGDKKCREGYPEPGVVFGCRMVLLKLCCCGRRVSAFQWAYGWQQLGEREGYPEHHSDCVCAESEIQFFAPCWFKPCFCKCRLCHLFQRGSGIQEVSLQCFWFCHKQAPDILLYRLVLHVPTSQNI